MEALVISLIYQVFAALLFAVIGHYMFNLPSKAFGVLCGLAVLIFGLTASYNSGNYTCELALSAGLASLIFGWVGYYLREKEILRCEAMENSRKEDQATLKELVRNTKSDNPYDIKPQVFQGAVKKGNTYEHRIKNGIAISVPITQTKRVRLSNTQEL